MHGLFRNVRPLVLASGSPRRRDMLAALGLDFSIRTSPDEPEPLAGEDPRAYALRCAQAKGRDVAGRLPAELEQAVVLAADTVVTVDGRILGKPRDVADARDTLALLAGREHLVITGCALLAQGASRLFAVSTTVRMAAARPELLAAYAACGEPLDKAGSYAIQGAGGFLVERIDGSASNVVGLPMAETVAALLDLGAVAPMEAAAVETANG